MSFFCACVNELRKKNQLPYVPRVTNTHQRQFYCYLLPDYQKSEIQPKTLTLRCALDAHAIIEKHKQTEKPSRDPEILPDSAAITS